MKFLFSFLLFILPSTYVSAQFLENFSDGNFTVNPSWNGNTSSFIIESQQLKSNSTIDNDIFYLSTVSKNSSGMVWQFFVNQKFQTSSANFFDVFILSDSANLKNTKNGYFVRIGNTKDEISLYKILNGTTTEIISGRDNLLSSSESILKIKLTRTLGYQFSLEDDISGTGNNYFFEGTTIDSSIKTSEFTGVKIRQSAASFHQKHYFDNYTISNHIPLLPNISKINVISDRSVSLTFNEAIDSIWSKNLSNYHISFSGKNPSSLFYNKDLKKNIILTFLDPFPEKIPLKIYAENIIDVYGNKLLKDSVQFTYIKKQIPEMFDIIFTEVMPKPFPVVGSLPAFEYIEILNRSAKFLKLSGCKLNDANSTAIFPDSILAPGEYAILCSDLSIPFYKSYGKAIGMKSLPSLNDAGDSLYITNDSGDVVCYLLYSNTWFDNLKVKGGWSLECIDTSNLCEQKRNFTASISNNGGTPGKLNSVNSKNKDLIAPEILFGFMENNKTAVVFFNEPIKPGLLLNTQNYTALSANPITLKPFDITHSSSKIAFTNSFVQGSIFDLQINNLQDCAGNSLQNRTIQLCVPDTFPQNTDLVINELLFDPKSFDDDFIELYNRGENAVNLKEILLANTNTDGSLNEIENASKYSRMIMPGQYLAITTSREHVSNYYKYGAPENIMQMDAMPAFSNTSGKAVILSKTGRRLDSFSYNSSMHFPLLNETEGVSLERIDFKRLSLDITNWHSAASNYGFGTPGRQNSMYLSPSPDGSLFSVTPETFSPDGDGFEDNISFNLILGQPGYFGSITIYDANGFLIKKAVPSQLFSEHSNFTWDGLDKNGNVAPVGLYVAYLEAIKQGQKTIREKITFALLRRQ